MNLRPDHSLGFARTWLRNQLHDGVKCPCCGQFAKVYRRNIHQTMAKALIQFYNAGGDVAFLNAASVAGPACEIGKTRYWGLIEQSLTQRGYWRLTPKGVAFVRGDLNVRKYAFIFDGDCQANSGPMVSINDCLGTRFDYAALMRGE